VLYSEIIDNTSHHIRLIELLLHSDHWDEKLPDCIVAPGLHALLVFSRCFLTGAFVQLGGMKSGL